MDLFRAHVLVCGGTGCSSSGSAELIKRFEEQIAKNGLDKEVKVVRTGCFGLCEAGPVVIVYPEGTFYSRIRPDDVDEIVSEHLLKGRIVKRLLYTETVVEDKIKSLDETDFYKKQKRVALRNCGVIDPENDVLTEVGRHSLALMKALDEEADFDALAELTRAVENSFLMETGQPVYIGVSEPREDLSMIAEAFEEARSAINIGRVYNSSATIFFYNRLLLERFLYDLPADVSARYSSQIFNRQTAKLFNDEMLHTIETFFENSLNLSETARKLYIHRNTLVYRLEKVQRAIGLDLRSFDDAVTFKMMMLLGKNTQPRKNRI